MFYAEETKDPLRPKGGTGQAVEMARRTIFSDQRPTFSELESYMRGRSE